MSLVDYTSSDEDGVNDTDDINLSPRSPAVEPKGLKRKREAYSANSSGLPPLPSKFLDLYASTTRASIRDDPSLHGGRKRITPHVEGNWPTHLYIEWYPSTEEHDLLTSLICSVRSAAADRVDENRMNSLLTSDLGAPLPLHISLSRPIGFKVDRKDSFVNSVHENIASCGVRPFELQVDDLDWVSNFEKTRWFLVLRLQKPEGDGLNRLLTICNKIVEEYAQPPLYATLGPIGQGSLKAHGRSRKHRHSNIGTLLKSDEASDFSSAFHISIAWALEQPLSIIMDITKAATNDEIFKSLQRISIKVDSLKVKVGNIVTSVSLPLKAAEGKSLFGV